MINKRNLLCKQVEEAFSIIDKDSDYSGLINRYWLSVPVSFDNICHYVRFPNGGTLTFQFDENGTITNVW